jgi:hypothetical protein
MNIGPTYLSMLNAELSGWQLWKARGYAWFFYNFATFVFILGLYLLQLMAGAFIRYEAGVDGFVISKYPVALVNEGWLDEGCFQNNEQTVCTFHKRH